MDVSLVLGFSILLQLAVVFLAVRLLRAAGMSLAWLAVVAALVLMLVRRSVTLFHWLTEDTAYQPDLLAEWLALLISLCILAGIVGVSRVCRVMHRNQEALDVSQTRYRSLRDQLEQRVADRTSRLAGAKEALESSVNACRASEAHLAESRMMLQRVLDAIPVRVFWKDLDSVYLGCNRHFANDAGLDSPQQIIGKDDYSLGWHEQADLYRADDKQVMSQGLEKINYEEPQTAPDGSKLVLRTSKIPLRDPSGKIFGILGCYEDITAQKRAQEELQEHRDHLEELVTKRTGEVQLQAQIIDQIHDSVVSTDLDGVVTSWNRGAERLFGYSAAEAVGKHIAFVYPREEHGFLADEVIAPLKQKGEHDVEVRMRRKDGSDFFAHLSLSLLSDNGAPKGMIGYSMDITARKQAEAALWKQTDILEAANRELQAFSYSVSHDLRAPLRAIDGFSQVLLDDYSDRLDDTGKDYLDRVRHGAQRMAELIDDLLDLSQVGRQELRRETVALSELADSIVNKLAETDPGRSPRVTVQRGLTAEGDNRLLEMLLHNLLGNAWKYTSKVDNAEIEFAAKKGDGYTVYYVRDNGAGFDMSYADKLFGTFQRLHGHEFEGTGIGLATVKRIVERHHGRVWGEGEVGKGATFYFTLGERR